MKMKETKTKKRQKGVTLTTLAITVVVLTIIAGIAIFSGKETIKKVKLAELKTNMLLIQAKAREYIEEVIFQMGTEDISEEKKNEIRKNIYEEEAGLTQNIEPPSYITNTHVYQLTDISKKRWGLKEIKTESDYLIQFNETQVAVEVYYTPGYEGKHSLREIENIKE